MHTRRYEKLAEHLRSGHVYRRDALLSLSTAIDRDLNTLVKKHVLEKAGAGLYYKPVVSRFGKLPPEEHSLISAFLRGDPFLLFSRNQYNDLGLGLTQLYNCVIVYNYKRYGIFELDKKKYDFRRPAKGFPRQLSAEFLLVDLVNNLDQLTEDVESIKLIIQKKINQYDIKKLKLLCNKHGKLATKRFFKEILHH